MDRIDEWLTRSDDCTERGTMERVVHAPAKAIIDTLIAERDKARAEAERMRTAILAFEKQSYLGWTRGQFDAACRELAEAAWTQEKEDHA